MSEMNEIGEIKAIAARSGYKGELSKGALEDCVAVYKRHLTRDGEPSPRSYWRAANHKRSNLSEFQWLLTNTDNFKKWFGKSVVVDENGEPKVMFHGSWNAFREFRVEQIKLSKTAMTLWSGPGFYFSDNRKSAEIYAGGKNNSIYEVFLRIEKPLIVDETGSSESPITKAQAEKIFLDGDNTQWLDSGIASELAQMDAEAGTKGKGGKHYYKGLTRAKRVSEYVSRLKTDVVKLKTAAKAFGAKSQKKLLDSVCRHTGHDGVIHTIEPGVKEYVVYDPKAIKSANSNDGEFSLSKATVEDSAMKEVNDKTDAQGRNHAPAGSSNGGQFVSSGELRGAAHRVRNHVLKGNPELKGVPVDAYESEISRAVSGENKNVDSLISTLTNLRAALGDEHGLTKKVRENLNAVKGEDSAESTKALTKKENVMKYEDLIRALSSIGGSKEVAMDIIDRQGRHHKPKGIPPGGQYEEEGQYLTGQAKVDHAIREAGSGKRANLLREHVAPLYAFLGKDSMERAKIQAMHEDIRGLSKNALLRGMAQHLKDMKRHADAYTAVKDMNKQEFLAWLDAHPEYKNELNMKLLNEGRYNKHFSVKGGYHDDGTGRQKHEAWEEAKWGIGAKAMASLILFQEHSDALSGAPDAIMANMIARASEEASLENREETPNQQIIANGEGGRSQVGPSDEDFRDAAMRLRNGNSTAFNSSDVNEGGNANSDNSILENAFGPEQGNIDYARRVLAGEALPGNSARIYVNALLRDADASNGGNFTQTQREAFRELANMIANNRGFALENGANNAPAGQGMTYTDREGNSHTVEHNEGGLKATIHPSELGAVQAEMSQAFADAGNEVDGAQEYAHALSHFLGRGNDERSPNPGMRQEGVSKYQLAEKMEARLRAKAQAVGAATTVDGQREAAKDLDATKRAVNRIAEICGITPDMLPEGTDHNHLRAALGSAPRAANPEHQGLVDALHGIGNQMMEPEATSTEPTESVAQNGQTQTQTTQTSQTSQTTQQRNEFTDEELNRLYIAGEGGFVPEDIRAAIEGRTGPDEIAPAEMASRLREFNGGEQSELRNRIADEIERRQRNGGSQAQGAQRQNEMPRGQNAENAPLATHLNETRDENGNSTYNFNRQGYTYGDTRTRRAAYTWPVRGNRPIAREQITPELIRAVSAHLPTGFGTWRHNNMADRMEMFLENPTVNSGHSTERLLRNLMTSRNIHARRYMQLLNTLHPNYASERRRQEEERQERRRQEENQRTVNGLSSMASNRPEQSIPMNVTDEQLNDAVNRVIGSVGEQHRNEVQSAFNNFRQHGSITTDQLSQLESVIGSDHPVYQEAQRIARERMTDEERLREEMKNLRSTTDANTIQADRKLAEDMGFDVVDGRAPNANNRTIGSYECNCYINTVCQRALQHGIKAKPKRGWGGLENTNAFAKRQMAYVRNFKPVQRDDGSVDVDRIRELKQGMKNGDSFSAWDGSHNVLITLYKGRFYKNDGYYGEHNVPVSDERVARHMTSLSTTGYDTYKDKANRGDRDARAKLALIKFTARHNIAKNGGDLTKISERDLEKEMRKVFMLANASFILPANAPMLKEELELLNPQ